MVSHDRDFLNNVVTSTLVLEGEGRVKEYAGGYDDWLVQRKEETAETLDKPVKAKPKPAKQEGPRRLKYAEKLELETLPGKVETLETKIEEVHAAMSDPEFYEQDHTEVAKAADELRQLEAELAETYARWEELEALS